MHPLVREDVDRILRQVDLEPLRGRRVLLTGANGLLGSEIARALFLCNQRRRFDCHVDAVSLHHPSADLQEIFTDRRFRFTRKDLTRRFRVTGRYDVLLHAAGYAQPAKFMADTRSTVAINVEATKVLLDAAARSSGTMVFFSSSTIYGRLPERELPVRESHPGSPSTLEAPRSVYVEAKRLGEALCAAAQATGVRSRIARIAHTYGPGISTSDDRALGHFLRMGLIDGRIVLRDPGQAVRTFGYVSDVVAMILFAALHGSEAVYNVGGREAISIKALAARVGRLCGVPVEAPPAGRGTNAEQDRPSVTKLWQEMGAPQLISLAKGLARTIAWNRDQLGVKARR